MMKRFSHFFLCFFLLTPGLARGADAPPKAKNVILMIADGCGFNSYLAGAAWKSGGIDREAVSKFPVLVGMSTFSITKDADPRSDLSLGYDPKTVWSAGGMSFRNETTQTVVTDSAAAATTMYTGCKTLNGRIGADKDKEPLKLLAEYAVERNRSGGAISSVMISHATPAAFGAHDKSRGDYESIFNNMLDRGPLSVMMGSGHPFYKQGKRIEFGVDKNGKPVEPDYQYLGGQATWNRLNNQGDGSEFLFFETVEDFRRMSQANKTLPEKMIGIAREHDSFAPKDGAPDLPEAKERLHKRFADADLENIPTLSEMSLGAIALLSRNPKGFVLMIEGGAIDWANHANDIELSVMETTSFLKAVEKVCEWVDDFSSWDETLVIVTADHETGDLWGPGTYDDENDNKKFDKGEKFNGFQKVVNRGQGRVPEVQYGYGSHTNQLVPLWAKGPGAKLFEKKVRGVDEKMENIFQEFRTPANDFHGQFIDNTDLLPVVLEVLK